VLAGVLHERRVPSASLKRPWRVRSRRLEASGSRRRPRPFIRKKPGRSASRGRHPSPWPLGVRAPAGSREPSVRQHRLRAFHVRGSHRGLRLQPCPRAVRGTPIPGFWVQGLAGPSRQSRLKPKWKATTYLKSRFLVERKPPHVRFISTDKQALCWQPDALSKTKVSCCQYL
jgi:hypothetical protein